MSKLELGFERVDAAVGASRTGVGDRAAVFFI